MARSMCFAWNLITSRSMRPLSAKVSSSTASQFSLKGEVGTDVAVPPSPPPKPGVRMMPAIWWCTDQLKKRYLPSNLSRKSTAARPSGSSGISRWS